MLCRKPSNSNLYVARGLGFADIFINLKPPSVYFEVALLRKISVQVTKTLFNLRPARWRLAQLSKHTSSAPHAPPKKMLLTGIKKLNMDSDLHSLVSVLPLGVVDVVIYVAHESAT